MKGFFLSKGVLPLCLISAVGIDTLILRSFCAAFTVHAAVSPEWDWTAASPEIQGMITSQLESIWTDLETRRATAFLVIRSDKIVFERFATGHNRTTKHYTASMAKALVGGISLSVALSDGRIALDDQAGKYVAQWIISTPPMAMATVSNRSCRRS